MKRVYFRCSGGEYFNGGACPWDGWNSAESLRLFAVAEKLTLDGGELSIDALRREGFSEATLRHVIVVDFGSSSAAFEALSPAKYVKDGRVQGPEEF